ncbi:MAG: hypothetical protein ACK5NG_03165 [Chthoniobacterales bacterium]
MAYAAESRVFTDKQGRTVEGEAVGVFGELISIKRKDNGQVIRVKISDISEEDQKFLQESGLIKSIPEAGGGSVQDDSLPRVDLDVYVRKSDVLSKTEMYDDRMQELSFNIKLTNRDSKKGLEKAKGTLVVFARSMKNRNVYQVVGREEFKFALKPFGKFEFATQDPIILIYDKSRDMSRWGMKYFGYICLIQDAEGRTVNIRAVPHNLKDKLDEGMALELYDVCNKDLRFLERGYKPYSHSSLVY